MAGQDVEDDIIYKAVLNHEEQYSIWPADRECPLGWKEAGTTGTKAECLAYIEEVWTDMRPLSLRREMDRLAAISPAPQTKAAEQLLAAAGDDLVGYLSQGEHPVQATAKSADQFLQRIESGYVNIKFTGTRGGTELNIKLDPAGTERHTDKVHIAGDLTLNYKHVRLVAEIALDTLSGFGRLQFIANQS